MSTAALRKRYQAELRAESVEPAAFTISDRLPTASDLACCMCGQLNAWLVHGVTRKRFCGECWPGESV